MHYFPEFGMFLLRLVSVVVAAIIILLSFVAILGHSKPKTQGKLTIKKINDKFKDYHHTIAGAIKSKKTLKAFKKRSKKSSNTKNNLKQEKPRIFVLQFIGDMRASAVNALREEITALLTVANKNDEVLLCLESPGGVVNAYGLAASQLQRVRDAGIRLVIAVDKVAASGGYMMACVADHIIAAPFAIIGSIGVVAQIPNFHRFLQKKSIDFEQLTAGKHKRTLTVFGQNTDEGREKMQSEVNEIHQLFKDFISKHRNSIDINKVATGEYWYATQAIEYKLVDLLKTSDDYILAASKEKDIFELSYRIKQPITKRLSRSATQLFETLFKPPQLP